MEEIIPWGNVGTTVFLLLLLFYRFPITCYNQEQRDLAGVSPLPGFGKGEV